MKQSWFLWVGHLFALAAIFPRSASADLNLPLGDINVVVLTDVHSWVGGHGAKESYDANYGDVLSFYQRLQEQMKALRLSDPEKHQHDLWIVNNGDWIDGTGLAMNGDPSYLVPILEKMPWDVVNVGNHELYDKDVIEATYRPGGFAEWWGSRYVNANVLHTQKATPVAHRYRLLKGDNANVLTFGFLYNMQGNDPSVTVQTVQDTIHEDWFHDALTTDTEMEGGYDAIMVLAHMDHQDELVKIILDRIRHFVSEDMPIQFIAGHTHYRGYSQVDNFSTSCEAGRFLDTVGFVSFPKQSTIRNAAAEKAAQEAAEAAAQEAAADSNSTNGNEDVSNETDTGGGLLMGEDSNSPQVEYHDTFEHVFIDAKYDTLAETLGLERNEMMTEDGMFLTEFIYNVQQDLGLNKIVGCIEQDYDLGKHPSDPSSLWNLYCNEVVPHVMGELDGRAKIVVSEAGAFRYGLYARELVLDEVIAVAPFNNSLYRFEGIPGSVLLDLNSTLNIDVTSASTIPDYIMCPNPAYDFPQIGTPTGNITQYDLVVAEFAIPAIEAGLKKVWPEDDGDSNSTADESLVPSIPDPVLMARAELDLWLEFFDTTDLCKTDNKGSHKPKPPPKVGPNSGGKNNKHSDSGNHLHKNETDSGMFSGKFLGPGTFKNASSLDRFRLLFYFVAICVMLVFTVVYVRQRARIYRREMMIQEMATQEALDEFNEKHGIAPPRYRDGESDDGIDDPPLGIYEENTNNTQELFMDEPASGIFPEDRYGDNYEMTDLEEAIPDAPPDLLS